MEILRLMNFLEGIKFMFHIFQLIRKSAVFYCMYEEDMWFQNYINLVVFYVIIYIWI